MRQEVMKSWLDALIDEWYRMRTLRTLSENCGDEFCTCLGFYYEMHFHLDSIGYDRTRMKELAAAVGKEIDVTDFDNKTDEIFFWYRGFKFFALDGKEK